MIHKSIFVLNLIQFYFTFVRADGGHRSTHAYIALLRAPRLIYELLPDTIDYCSAIVWLCALHLMYEIVNHYSSLDMTMYTYVH